MSPAIRNRALWLSLVVSFVLHLAAILFLDLGREVAADRAFRARLAVVPRFEPHRLAASRPRKLPRTEMEYLPSSAVPEKLSAEEEISPAYAPALVVPDLPTALREFSVGGKPDTLVLAREQLPRAADFAWTNAVGQAEAFDLLRMQDLARRERQPAAVIPGQTTRRDVSGYVNLSRLRVYGAGTDTALGLDGLARYVRDHTGILTRATGTRYDYFLSEGLLASPIHFLVEGGGWEPYRNEYVTQFSDEEKVMLGRYLREGGFLFIEGSYRYLREMIGHLEQVLGDDGRLFPVPVSHLLYHSYYEFAGGFPSEYHKEQVVEVAGSSWYYPGTSRADDAIPASPTFSSEELEAPPTLPRLGIWGVEVNGEIVAILSDLGMYVRWGGLFQTDPSNATEPFLQAGTNILVYVLTRQGGVTEKRAPPAWAKTKPTAPLELAGEAGSAEYGWEQAELGEQAELFADLDASLALIQSPYGTAIAQNGISLVLDGRYSLDLLKRGAHGLILHNLPAGDHWLEVSYGGKSSQMEVRLEGGKVSTVTFGLSRLAMFSSLRIKQQEEVVAVEHWLHSFDDLIIEELFLGEDKQLLE